MRFDLSCVGKSRSRGAGGGLLVCSDHVIGGGLFWDLKSQSGIDNEKPALLMPWSLVFYSLAVCFVKSFSALITTMFAWDALRHNGET